MIIFRFFSFFFIVGFYSCSTTDSSPNPEEPEVIMEDAYNYIVLRHDGQLFEIGDNTGKINAINKIPGIEFISALNAVTASTSKIYFYEHKFPLQPLIHEYNFVTSISKSHVIEFKEEDFGAFAGLESLEWDENKKILLAFVKENFGENHPGPSRIAQIDPITFKVTSMNFEVPQKHIMGTLIKGDVIYASSYRTTSMGGVNGFFKIDLLNGLITGVEVDGMTIAPIHLSHNPEKNTLFGFLPVEGSSFMGASKPVEINPVTGTVKQLLPGEVTGTHHQFGRSFFNAETKEHVDLITSSTYLALFRYDSRTQKVTLTKLPHPNDLDSFNTIVGVVKL